jgi:hypothetical protein
MSFAGAFGLGDATSVGAVVADAMLVRGLLAAPPELSQEASTAAAAVSAASLVRGADTQAG